jgi:acyl dehydratase
MALCGWLRRTGASLFAWSTLIRLPTDRSIGLLTSLEMKWLRMSKTFDDYKVGETFVSQARTITETDLVNFIAFAGLKLAIFRDEEYSKKHGLYGRRICPGFLVASIASGMIEDTIDMTNLLVALGLDGFKFSKPVFPNDTIHISIEILSSRETKRPDRGIVGGRISVINQDDEIPLDFTATWLFAREMTS